MRDHFPITRRELVLIGAALAVGLALRLYFYTGLMASDDLTHARAAATMFDERGPFVAAEHSSVNSGVNGRRIGVNILLYTSIRLFGKAEWAYSLVTLLASLLGILIAAFTLRRFAIMLLAGQRGKDVLPQATAPPSPADLGVVEIASVGAAWLWATLPIDIYTATVWMQDNIFATVLMATLYCLMRLNDRPYRFAFFAGLGLGYLQFCKETAAFLGFVIGAWFVAQIIFDKANRRTWLVRLAALTAGFLLVNLAASLYFWSVSGSFFHYYTTTVARYLVVATDMPARYPSPYNWLRFLYYIDTNWIFGFGAVLMPFWMVAYFSYRRVRYRLLIASVLGIQLFILLQALKLVTWTQRYTMQVSAIYVFLTAAGILCAARWLPAALRKDGKSAPLGRMILAGVFGLVVLLQLVSLRISHQQHGRFRAQTVRDAYNYLDRTAGAQDRIYVDWTQSMPTYVKRSFEVLNEFEPMKGGIYDYSEAESATDGWVVLSHLEHNYRRLNGLENRILPANWLEVFRSENNHGKYWIRVFRILPNATDIRVIRTPAKGDTVDVTGLQFQLRAAAELSISKKWQSGLAAIQADSANPAGFTISAKPTSGHHYGGVEFAVDGLTALRFVLSAKTAADVEAVFVYAHDVSGTRSTRWRWSLTKEQRAGDITTPVVLMPGEPSAGFFVINADVPASEIARVTVLLRVRAGATVAAQLNDLGTVEPRRAPTPAVPTNDPDNAPTVNAGAVDAGTSPPQDASSDDGVAKPQPELR